MSQDELHLAASGQKHAFIRDGALILYFDKAEVPFVARFDLDSLAQANFEVTDKKDGIFNLTLRDYSGDAQTIGQFSSKTDAHQALYLILQALLDQPESTTVFRQKKCGVFRRVVKGLLKAALVIALAFAVLWVVFWFQTLPARKALNAPEVTTSQNQKAETGPLATVPEGEAVDADTALKNLMLSPEHQAPVPTE